MFGLFMLAWEVSAILVMADAFIFGRNAMNLCISVVLLLSSFSMLQ
jgi:hypothetical protein